jgi:cell shape-determining protein MreD
MAGVLFVNIYNSIVDAVSWGSNVPASIDVMRHYYYSTNPGKFFRYFSPANQVLALLVLILFWKSPKKVRFFLAAAFLLSVLTDVFTFSYFYPANNLLLTLPLANVSKLSSVVHGWQLMNWLRSLIITVELSLFFLGLNGLFKLKLER